MSLSFLQLTKFLLPLITLPYLVRVLGVEKYGLVAFAASLVNFFINFTDYGFNLTATRSISNNRGDRNKLSEIFSSVIVTKILLGIAGLLVMSIIVLNFSKFRINWLLYYVTYIRVFALVLFPVWFFQGVENMKFIAIINLLSRLFFTAAIFVFIRQPSDYIYVPLLHSIGSFIGALVSLYIVYNKFHIGIVMPRMINLVNSLKEGFSVFISSFIPTLYNSSSVFILGIFTSDELVGIYVAGKRIIDLLINVNRILSRTFFPFLNVNFKYHPVFIKLSLGLGIFSSLFAFVFSGLIVDILLTPEFIDTKMIIRILCLSPFFVSVIAAYGTNYLLIMKKDKLYMKIVLTISLISFSFLFLLVGLYGHWGAAINLVITRGFIALFIFVSAIRIIKLHSAGSM